MGIENLIQNIEFNSYPIEWPGHSIAGQWIKPSLEKQKQDSINPNNRQLLVQASTTPQIIDDVMSCALNAVEPMHQLEWEQIEQILNKFKAFLIENKKSFERILKSEAGKPHGEAVEEWSASLELIDEILTLKESIYENMLKPFFGVSVKLHSEGVILAYLSFSTSLVQFTHFFISSLLAKSPLVLFCPPQTFLLGTFIAHSLNLLELKPGALNIIYAGYSYFKLAISKASSILYSGSHEHCEEIFKDHHSDHKKRLLLQEGGKNSLIVSGSANISLAAEGMLLGTCKAAGQLCTSTSRAFVHESVLPKVLAELKSHISKLFIGPTNTNTHHEWHMGALYSEKMLEKFLRFQTMGSREAIETLSFGRAISQSIKDGFFVSPAIRLLESFDSKSAYQNNVLFSPDLAIYSYKNLDSIIEVLQKTKSSMITSFYGNPHEVKDQKSLMKTPNLIFNKPTSVLHPMLSVAGRSTYGRHRFQRLGLFWYLTYPQSQL